MSLSKKNGTNSLKKQLFALRNVPKFLKMVWRIQPFYTFFAILLRLLRSIFPLVTLYIGKLIIDEVLRLSNAAPDTRDLVWLWQLVGAELALALFADLLNRAVILLESMLGDLLSNATSLQLMQHAASLDLYHFEDAEFYDKLERARRQTVSRVVLMSQILTQVQDFVTILFLGIGLTAFNPWLILLLAVAVLPSFVGELYFNQRNYSLSLNWTPERRELDYLRYIGASDVTAKEIKIFGLTDFIADRFAELSHRYFIANRNLSLRHASWGLFLAALGTLAYYGAYGVIIGQTVGGILTLGTLTFLAGSFRRMSDMMQAIMSRFTQIASSALYLQDLFDFLSIQPIIRADSNAPKVPQKMSEGIEFQNVGFKYDGSERWAVRGVSFRLRPGEKLALVGENGAGKTTLVKLLARLYEPTEGRILLDGRDLREYDLASVRGNMGVIFQDFFRFNFTAKDNIAVGQVADVENMPKIDTAATKSLANSVIRKLPKGYDQMLGKRFSEGIELSGGEWQKIALARAYMRDAQILILDEPTAALDARAEHEIFVRFAELMRDRAAVLISHRFSTVRMADKILVLENGELKEAGSHTDLIKLNGKYAELFSLQAKGYQ